MEIYVDRERAHNAFQALLKVYRDGAYPFSEPEVQPPQVKENMPKTLVYGSLEHASYLKVSCFWMRGGIRSVTAFQLLSTFYDAHPEFFVPSEWKRIDPVALCRLLQDSRLGFQANFISRAWRENFRRIAERHDGDPVNLVRGVASYEEACGRIKNSGKEGLLGFREKMVSMLIYFFLDARLVVPSFAFPLPVDFHVCRIVLANELVVVKNPPKGDHYKPEVLAVIRELVVGFCVETGTDVIEFCNALWLFSQAMCARYAGNESLQIRGSGRQAVIEPAPRWSLAQTAAFYRSCDKCVLASTCRWAIPSMNYYISGQLILREPREVPTQGNLFKMLV